MNEDMSIRRETGSFILGLFGFICLGFLVGIIFGDKAIATPSSQWGAFANTFKYALFMPFILTPFIVAAYITKNWFNIGYPVLSFVIAGWLRQTALVQWLGAITPGEMNPETVYHFEAVWAVTLAYVASYALLHPITRYMKVAPNVTKRGQTRVILVHICLGIVTVLGLYGAVSRAPAWYAVYQRWNHTVRLPWSPELFASPTVIAYGDAKKMGTNTYQFFDYIYYKPVKHGTRGNMRSNCGDGIRSTGIDVAFTHLKTPNGIAYGEGSQQKNNSQPPSPEHAYTEYVSCFVLDGTLYQLNRKETAGDRHIAMYPTAKVIDIISKSQEFVYTCEKSNKIPNYCRTEDIEKITKLQQHFNSSFTRPYLER